jgi:hypothetical protein
MFPIALRFTLEKAVQRMRKSLDALWDEEALHAPGHSHSISTQ